MKLFKIGTNIEQKQSFKAFLMPYQVQVNWDKIWKGIRKARSIHGKGKMSGLEFIRQDRLSH